MTHNKRCTRMIQQANSEYQCVLSLGHDGLHKIVTEESEGEPNPIASFNHYPKKESNNMAPTTRYELNKELYDLTMSIRYLLEGVSVENAQLAVGTVMNEISQKVYATPKLANIPLSQMITDEDINSIFDKFDQWADRKKANRDRDEYLNPDR